MALDDLGLRMRCGGQGLNDGCAGGGTCDRRDGASGPVAVAPPLPGSVSIHPVARSEVHNTRLPAIADRHDAGDGGDDDMGTGSTEYYVLERTPA